MRCNCASSLKMLIAGSLLACSLVIAVPAFAFVGDAPAFQEKSTDYPRGAFIIKFRDEAVVGAVAEELLQGQQPFRDVTGDANLDRLNARHKVKAMRRLFGKEANEASPGRIDRQTAATLHRQQHNDFRIKIASIRDRRLKKKGLTGKTAPTEKDPPYLGSVYKVELDLRTNIEDACREYANDPHIAYCQPDYRMQAQWIPNDPYYASFSSWGQGYDDMWGLKKLETAAAWDVTRGAGVVVAVVDSGADYNHVDLSANMWSNSAEIPGNGIDDDNNGFVDDVRGWDFHNGDNDPMDGNGHGTHVSGTIAAVGDNATGIVGVAPSAKIMPLKGLSDLGSGFSSALAAAIKYAADNGADVINNSWGCGSACYSNPLAEDAVRYAHDLGSVVVFAAGNSKDDVTLYSPQNQSNSVITVASSSELDTRSYFSNIGSLIDVAAPGGGDDGGSPSRIGRNILSLRAGTTDMYADGLCIVGGNYYRSRGTSMAAPHVSGLAALVVAAHPEFTPDDVSQALRASADDIGTTGFDLLSGAGRVNARQALSIASVPRVKISGPLGEVDATRNSTVTIRGDAFGPNFASYRLYYATLDKTNSGEYLPTAGQWQELGPASYQGVTDGVLATFDTSLLQKSMQYYLIRLEVTTTDNSRFSDVNEILLYKDDPRFYRLAAGGPGGYSDSTSSEGDRFAWVEAEPPLETGGETRYVGKVYDGATNRLLTIYPERTYIKYIYLYSNRIAWGEYNTALTVVGSIGPDGEIIVERNLPYGMYSADQGRLLLNNGGSIFTGVSVYVYDINTNTLSPAYTLPPGDPSQFHPVLHGDSVVTNMWYPGGVNDDMTVNLTDLPTGVNEVVRVVPGDGWINGAINGPGVVVWNEDLISGDYKLWYFDKSTREIKNIGYSHPSSFAADKKSIVYSAFGSMDWGWSGNNLYSYDIQTGNTTLFATKFVRADDMYPSFGTRHVHWYRGADSVMVTNTMPVLSGISGQAVPLNAPVTIQVSALDPDGDRIDLDTVGGTWPDAATQLPANAAFTDNGNGTGSLQWTPTTSGLQTVSFLARDFTGRKEGTWNVVQKATFLVYDTDGVDQPLGVTISGNGAVHSSPNPDINCLSGTCSQSCPKDTPVTLTATPDTGFVFSGWSGACTGTGNCSVTMSQARMVTATFMSTSGYPLTVTVSGSGAVHSSSPDINCVSGTCIQSFNDGTIVTLVASPTAGYTFSGWSGACAGTGTCIVTMGQARNVTAGFAPSTDYALSVTVSGNGAVHSSPMPDINCSAGTCTQSYSSGTVVNLTPSLAPGFVFSGWSGPCSGTGACTVAMDQARSVTATFASNPKNTLFVTIAGGGAVHSSPLADISCTAGTCSQPYNSGLIVTLTASANAGWRFAGWSGACSGNGSCTVAMSETRSITAIFSDVTYPLEVTISGGGAVHSSPAPDINCTAGTCTQPYFETTVVTLTAAPGTGSAFLGWSGVCSGINDCTVTMDQAKSVSATFTSASNTLRTLTVNAVSQEATGTVTTSPHPGINCTTPPTFSCVQPYISGTSVTLDAAAPAGSYVNYLGGDCVATGSSCSFIMDRDRTISVSFVPYLTMINSGYFKNCGDAYNGATNGSIIKTLAGTRGDFLTANRDVSVSLEGGYDPSFTTLAGYTTLNQLTVASGTLSISDLILNQLTVTDGTVTFYNIVIK